MKKRRVLLLLICLFIVRLSYAEYFKHFGHAEGLSQSSVMAIYQDQLGRMWFGTREGVSIYNKSSMTVYKGWVKNSARPDDKILIGNEVSAITGDDQGNVFLAIDESLLKYDIRKESFSVLQKQGIGALTSYRGTIWCSVRDSIFCLNSETGQLEFRLKTHLSSINHLLIDGSTLYIGARYGLYASRSLGPVRCLIPNVDVYRTFKSS